MLAMEVMDDDCSENDDDEIDALITNLSNHSKTREKASFNGEEEVRPKAKANTEYSPLRFIMFTIVNMSAIFMIYRHVYTTEKSSESANQTHLLGGDLFQCAEEIPKAKNDLPGTFDYYHEHNSNHLEDTTSDDFRHEPYAGREETYNFMKNATTEFKARTFGDNLRNGDSMYESACGEGLNLLMTLEILKEERGIENIVVYGNDYLADSVALANTYLSSHDWFKKGKICQGDSSNLFLMPSSSFDLAYTGYIDTIVDPYNILDSKQIQSYDEKSDFEYRMCKSKSWARKKISELNQQAQENWFASWVSELIRIVKPGKVVIVETVDLPLCSSAESWGGVSKVWWAHAVKKYNWDVNVGSIEITDHPIDHGRYNVVMRRNI